VRGVRRDSLTAEVSRRGVILGVSSRFGRHNRPPCESLGSVPSGEDDVAERPRSALARDASHACADGAVGEFEARRQIDLLDASHGHHEESMKIRGLRRNG
jgi:hypothetical protein